LKFADKEEEDGIGARILAGADTEYEQLAKENVSTILSYGDNFMDTLCKDACDGHDVGRVNIYALEHKIDLTVCIRSRICLVASFSLVL